MGNKNRSKSSSKSSYNNNQSSERSDSTSLEIRLNIYDINKLNCVLQYIGIGIYHSSIQIDNIEFSYGSHSLHKTGVFQHILGNPFPGAKFKNSILLGKSTKSFEQLLEIIEELKIEYYGCYYDLLKNNCHNFTEDFCLRVFGIQIPSYINRIARLGDHLRCLLPKKLVQGPRKPVTQNQNQGQNSLNDSRIYRKNQKAKSKLLNEVKKTSAEKATDIRNSKDNNKSNQQKYILKNETKNQQKYENLENNNGQNAGYQQVEQKNGVIQIQLQKLPLQLSSEQQQLTQSQQQQSITISMPSNTLSQQIDQYNCKMLIYQQSIAEFSPLQNSQSDKKQQNLMLGQEPLPKDFLQQSDEKRNTLLQSVNDSKEKNNSGIQDSNLIVTSNDSNNNNNNNINTTKNNTINNNNNGNIITNNSNSNNFKSNSSDNTNENGCNNQQNVIIIKSNINNIEINTNQQTQNNEVINSITINQSQEASQ